MRFSSSRLGKFLNILDTEYLRVRNVRPLVFTKVNKIEMPTAEKRFAIQDRLT